MSNQATEPASKLSKQDSVLYWSCIVASIMCWSPNNLAGYVAPVAFFVATSLLVPQIGFLVRVCFIVSVWILQTFFYMIINPDFLIPNSLVSLATWFGFIVIIVYPSSNKINYLLVYKKLLGPTWMLLLIESGLGIIQGIYGLIRTGTFDLGTGDYVEGTLHPQLEPELSFANPMFSINIALLLLFLTADLVAAPTIRKITIYTLGFVSIVIASTLHVLLFLIVSVILSMILVTSYATKYRKLGSLSSIAIFLALALVLLYIIQPSNFQNISNVLQMRDTPRFLFINVLNYHVPKTYWFSPIFGIGNGQFASRAGMISTGLYFGGRWMDEPSEFTTKAQHRFFLPLKQWQFLDPMFSNSSSTVPHFSWIAVYSEWGLIGIASFMTYFVIVIFALLRQARLVPIEAALILASVIFFFLLGWQEIYWEVPQAWFSGMVLLKILYFKVKRASTYQ